MLPRLPGERWLKNRNQRHLRYGRLVQAADTKLFFTFNVTKVKGARSRNFRQFRHLSNGHRID